MGEYLFRVTYQADSLQLIIGEPQQLKDEVAVWQQFSVARLWVARLWVARLWVAKVMAPE